MTDWSLISTAIASATGQPFRIDRHKTNGGGCINEAFTLEGADGGHYFVKLNDARHLPMLIAEAAGLETIAATNTIRVPRPIAHGSAGGQSYLVLEHLELCSRGNARLLGEQLAALHRSTPPSTFPLPCREGARGRVDTSHPNTSTPILTFPLQGGRNEVASQSRFGFSQDNFLGTTPQPNAWADDWITFWRERRLGYQFRLAAENGHGGQLQRLGERLMDALPAFFDGYTPQPSLLHGDLWGGNHAYLADGTPAIFDPAPYYGDRECDLAMTELFGGYGAGFYAAYRAAWPLDSGYAVRKELYNLYHILNHANLFGGGYARQAEGMMQRLLSEVA